MATTVITRSEQVLKRTWGDLDPKVRNAADVWILTIATGIIGLLTKAITPIDEAYLLVPVTLAVITAYVTTSKHKKLIIEAVDAVDKVVHDAAPVLSHDVRTAAVAGVAVGVADAVKEAVDDNVTQIIKPDPNQTVAYTPNAKMEAILNGLPSAGGKPVADPVAVLHPNGVVTGSNPIVDGH